MEIFKIVVLSLLVIIAVFSLISSFVVTKQKEVKIIERFGKFVEIRRSGLTFKVPFIDTVAHTTSKKKDSKEEQTA